jgi:hypothetical protein
LNSAREFGPHDTVVLHVVQHQIRIDCPDPVARVALSSIFAAFRAAKATPSPSVLEYVVAPVADHRYLLQVPGGRTDAAAGLDELVYMLEQSIVVELQKGNPALLFLHAAALEWHGRACLLVADSGGGKSTTAWALLHHGFGYLSDELAPIALDAMQVLGYPHALCLKREVSAPYTLPAATVSLGRTMHVPTAHLPLASAWDTGRPLAAVFHLAYTPSAPQPTLSPMSAAAATALLYVNALNALSHPACGLDAVKRVAEHVPNFRVTTGDLPQSCALIKEALETSLRSAPA